MTAPGSCGGHGGLPPELRALALLALDRLEPAVERLRDLPANGAVQAADVCASCPLCAVLAVLRGERPEMAARLAEHATGLLSLLRAALLPDPGESWSAAGRVVRSSSPDHPRESWSPAGRDARSDRTDAPGEQDAPAGRDAGGVPGRGAPSAADPDVDAPGSADGPSPDGNCALPAAESGRGDRPEPPHRGARPGAAARSGRTVQRIPVTR